MKIEAAIFDMDGTLLDSMPVWETAGSRYVESRGFHPPEDLRRQIETLRLEEAAACIKKAAGLPDSLQEIMDGVNAIIGRAYMREVEPKPGAAALLAALQAHGVRLCLATATDRCLVEAALARHGLLDYFERIFTCTEVGAGKTQPLIFEQALAFLGTPRERTWVFEDAIHAVRTAKAAGFPVAAVYDRAEKHQPELKALADLYGGSLPELEEKLWS